MFLSRQLSLTYIQETGHKKCCTGNNLELGLTLKHKVEIQRTEQQHVERRNCQGIHALIRIYTKQAQNQTI